jgi:Fe-S cluster assembly iron-binding protein IscA
VDELKDENDVVVESQGITVVYNSDIEGYVCSTVIDYSDSWFERGFIIRGSQLSSC